MKLILSLICTVLLSAMAGAQLTYTEVHNYYPIKPVKHYNHHNKDWFVFAGALAFEQYGAVYDAKWSERGIRSGIAVEGNTFLLGTDKPTFWQLERRDLTFYVPILSVAPVVAKLTHHRPWFFGSLSGFAALGVSHIQGGSQWKKLINGQAENCIYAPGGCK